MSPRWRSKAALVSEPPDLRRLISASRLRLSRQSPFFSTLALHTPFHVSERVPTAATDGQAVFVNPRFFEGLTPAARDGLLLHEVLHAALLHVNRRGARDPQLWNIAADIVVNGILVRNGFTIPEGGLRDIALERLSVEEVYDKVAKDESKSRRSVEADLLEGAPAGAAGSAGDSKGDRSGDRMRREGQWRNALREAADAAEASGEGRAPAGMEREVESVREPQLDWRSYLWRFLTRTPVDFEEFDRRFVGRGLYLETISGQSVTVLVAVDTSASIQRALLSQFMGEVSGILLAYPGLRCDLYYADAALDGPHTLTGATPPPPAKGGGGTDFRPFFAVAERDYVDWPNKVAVYLTDGFGSFPERAPDFPTLWVVTPGGRSIERFPFGEVVRLVPTES